MTYAYAPSPRKVTMTDHTTSTEQATQTDDRQRRRRFETPTRRVHREWAGGGRQEERENRALAEEWWQALRLWKLEYGEDIRVHYGPARASRMRVVGVGGYTTGNTGSGSGGSYTAQVEYVRLPSGKYPSSLVGQLCAADPHLAEVYRGAGLASLIHSSGRGWASQRARACGLAVLELAGTLAAELPNA